MVYRLGWKIIFKKFIIEVRNINIFSFIFDYEFDLVNIRIVFVDSVFYLKVLINLIMINNYYVVGGYRELKKKLRGDLKRKILDSVV